MVKDIYRFIKTLTYTVKGRRFFFLQKTKNLMWTEKTNQLVTHSNYKYTEIQFQNSVYNKSKMFNHKLHICRQQEDINFCIKYVFHLNNISPYPII